MSATLRVRLQNDTSKGFKSIDGDMQRTAQTAKQLGKTTNDALDPRATREYRDSLRQVVQELQRIGTTAQQTHQATAAIRDQALAARDLNATAQQTTVINQQSGASLGDVAIFAGKAYLQFRLLNALKQAAIPLWQKHRTAVLASGAALGGLVVTAGAVGVALLGVQAAVGAAGSAIGFMKSQNIGDIKELTDATTTLKASWTNLQRTVLDTDLVKGIVQGIASRIDTVSANVRLAQELGVDLATAVTEADSLADALAQVQDADGWKNARHGVQALVEDFVGATWQAKAFRFALKGMGVDTDKAYARSGMKADRSVLEEANQRTRGDAQGYDVEKWLKDRDKKAGEETDLSELRRLQTVKAINAAIAEQTELLQAAADGSEGSAERIAKHKKNLQELDKARAAAEQKAIAEQLQQTERIQKLERKGHADSLKERLEVFDTVDKVTKRQQDLVEWVKRLNQQHRLTKEILEDAEQGHQALEQRKIQLVQERKKAEEDLQRTMRESDKRRWEFEEERRKKQLEEVEAKLQELREALQQAQGPNGGSLLGSLRGQFSQRDIERDVIGNRQAAAREQRLEELRGQGKIDQFGKAIGNSPNERAQNQRRVDHELQQLARDTLKQTFREIRTGKVSGDEFRAARDTRVLDQAREQMKGGKLDPVVFQQLQQQLQTERQQLTRQLELQAQVKQVSNLGTPQKGGPFGLQAMQQQAGGNAAATQAQLQAGQATMQQMGANGELSQQMVQLSEQQLRVATNSLQGIEQLTARVDSLQKQTDSQFQASTALWTKAGGLKR